MQPTEWTRGLDVEVRGDDVTSHTGTVMTRMLVDRTGVITDLSGALARSGYEVVHDRGRVLADLAVAIADRDIEGVIGIRIVAT